MDERKRDSMIAYLRHRMEEFGIKPEDLAAVLASEPAAKKGEWPFKKDPAKKPAKKK